MFFTDFQKSIEIHASRPHHLLKFKMIVNKLIENMTSVLQRIFNVFVTTEHEFKRNIGDQTAKNEKVANYKMSDLIFFLHSNQSDIIYFIF